MRVERVAQRQRACLPGCCWARQGSRCACVCWSAAGQREWCCKLQRAERELCGSEQRREQRRVECQCCWVGRDGPERVECWRAAWAHGVRGQRLGQRQRSCVQGAWRCVWRSCGGCVCWSAAGQRQLAVELRRAECELCRSEQRRLQRVFECDCCGAGRGGDQRLQRQGAGWRDCMRRERVAERQRGCVPQRVRRVS